MRRLSPDAAAAATMLALTLAPGVALLGAHGVFNGTYGIDVPDLMQYMAFIRESGQHLLIANPFDVVPDPHIFLDPVFTLSGLLWRLGASIQLAFLIWVPLSAVLIFCSFRAYARSVLGPGAAAAMAVMIALLFLTPATALADWLHAGVGMRFGTEVAGLEMFAGSYAWSGPQAIAIGLMPLCVLLSQRLLAEEEAAGTGLPSLLWRGRRTLALGAMGVLVTWIHPWQGLTLLVLWTMLALWARLSRGCAVLLLPAVFTALPLGYFEVLSHTRSSWMTVSGAQHGYTHFGGWLYVSLAPLLLALPGYRGRAVGVGERALRLWPVAALAVYFALDRTWFYHALIGITLPLALLAVRGWGGLRLPRALVGGTLAVVLVPGLVWMGQQLSLTRSQHFFRPSEARALALLARLPRQGPVLAPAIPLGQAVPAFTGRSTYTGHPTWTPGYFARSALAEELFDGQLPPAQVSALLRVSRAAFLVSDCGPRRRDLRALLGRRVARTWRLGCATVYELAGSRQAQSVAPSVPRAGVPTVNPASRRVASSSPSAFGTGA